jgi:hypothetical protein
MVPVPIRGDLQAAHTAPGEPSDDLTHRRALDRAQMELTAKRISALPECFY